jgi:hypothetical protein
MVCELWFQFNVGVNCAEHTVGPVALTEEQHRIREKNKSLPRHVKRSVDEYRVALGLAPLWGFLPSFPADSYFEVQRKRRLARERQRKHRERTKGGFCGR